MDSLHALALPSQPVPQPADALQRQASTLLANWDYIERLLGIKLGALTAVKRALRDVVEATGS
jgi:hypothetical protein